MKAGLAFLVLCRASPSPSDRKNTANTLSFRKRRSSWISKWRCSRCRRRVVRSLGGFEYQQDRTATGHCGKGHSGYDATLSQTTIEHQEGGVLLCKTFIPAYPLLAGQSLARSCAARRYAPLLLSVLQWLSEENNGWTTGYRLYTGYMLR